MRIIKGGGNELKLDESGSVKLSPMEVQRAGTSLKVTLLTIGSEEGLTTRQAAELFNIGESAIHKHIQRHAIRTGLIVRSILQLLKTNGIIRQQTSHAVFIPRYGLRELLRVIDTDEARAAYHQLFDDAEELFQLKPRYIALEQQLQEKELQISSISNEREHFAKRCSQLLVERNEALVKAEESQQQNEELAETVKSYEKGLRETRAKLEAAVNFIETSGKKKKYRHRIAEIEFAGVNIFEGPQYRVAIKKLTLEEMNPKERNAHAVQKSAVTAYGIAKSVKKRMETMEVSNPKICEKAGVFCDAGKDLVEAILPSPNALFGLNDDDQLSYLT